MAKTGKIDTNLKKFQAIERLKEKRAELRKASKNINNSLEDRMAARRELSQMPRKSAETRFVNRCRLTGRPRGFLRKFGLSRIAFRELALRGEIPGVTKSSW